MRAERRQALVDFLLEAVADEGTTPFPADVLAGLRRVVRCEAVGHWEWSARELLEFSLAADDPAQVLPVWGVYPQVRQDDPFPAGGRIGARCRTGTGSGGLWRSPTSSATASSAAGGSTPRSASRWGCGR